MNRTGSSYIYKTGGLSLEVFLKDDSIILNREGGSYSFLQKKTNDQDIDYTISFSITGSVGIPDVKPVFTGSSFADSLIPYEWNVYESADHFSLIIKLKESPSVVSAKAVFQLDKREISVDLKLAGAVKQISLDPFFQPLGPLMLSYITHSHNGLLIHASGVNDGRNGYVFSAVSGTGKSTMARLWQSKGAQIINDDRLILVPRDGNILMTNTPMPYYQDVYKECNVTAIFLLKQSKTNYLKRLTGAPAIAKMMANCIQFLYNKEMVEQHLKSISGIVEQIPVFELGFKPTTEITDIIRSEFGS